MRLQPLLQQADEAGAGLGADGKRIARHVPCKPEGGGKHTLRFNLGLIKHSQSAGACCASQMLPPCPCRTQHACFAWERC